jgi:heme A synthase
MSSTTRYATTEDSRTNVRSALYSSLIGLAALGVLLQAVWAGLFIREGQDNNNTFVEVHARGAEITLALAVVATVVALVRLRGRRDLVVGSAVFTVLLVLEAFLGGLIGEHSALQVLHFPLALALMGLAVWLPLRARRRHDPRSALRATGGGD